MGEVTAMPGHVIAIPEGQADTDIVAALEELLAKAKAGQIRAIAWCSYKSTDMVARGWVTGAYGFHLTAAIALLQHDYWRELSGNDA